MFFSQIHRLTISYALFISFPTSRTCLGAFLLSMGETTLVPTRAPSGGKEVPATARTRQPQSISYFASSSSFNVWGYLFDVVCLVGHLFLRLRFFWDFLHGTHQVTCIFFQRPCFGPLTLSMKRFSWHLWGSSRLFFSLLLLWTHVLPPALTRIAQKQKKRNWSTYLGLLSNSHVLQEPHYSTLSTGAFHFRTSKLRRWIPNGLSFRFFGIARRFFFRASRARCRRLCCLGLSSCTEVLGCWLWSIRESQSPKKWTTRAWL